MIIAFTGAGISQPSGIPTFGEQEGLRDKLTRTFARTNPQEYEYTIQNMKKVCDDAIPNDAHIALAEYKIPVITMNVDNLHQRAGSENVLPIHGSFPNIVLYEDPAPNYEIAHNWVFQLRPGDIFLIVGTSFYTMISESLKVCAMSQGARVVILNDRAETKVRGFLDNHREEMGSFEDFINREMET